MRKAFLALMQDVDALLLGRRTYVTHAEAFEPMPPGDPFGDIVNAPKKYVVSRTLEKPLWLSFATPYPSGVGGLHYISQRKQEGR